MVAARSGSRRLRVERVGRLAGPRLGFLERKRRQVTDHPVGVIDGTPTLDGEGVVWFQDESGDESGRGSCSRSAEARPALCSKAFRTGGARAWRRRPGIVAAGLSDRDGFAVYVSLRGSRGSGGVPLERVGSPRQRGRGRIPARRVVRGRIASSASSTPSTATSSTPRSRSIDPRSGATVGEQLDEGMSLIAKCWSPVAGDQRLAFDHERGGEERPGLWDLASGERHDLEVDLEGAVFVHDWWPDASALLLVNRFEGRDRLFRYELGTGALEPAVDRARRDPESARPPRRTGLAHHEQGHRQRLLLDDTGRGGRGAGRRTGTGRPAVPVVDLRQPARTAASTASTSRRTTRAGRSRC